jgi:hypothetical protein
VSVLIGLRLLNRDRLVRKANVSYCSDHSPKECLAEPPQSPYSLTAAP